MSDAVWDEIAGGLGTKIATDLRAMVVEADARADRSQQKHLGPSQIGNPCTYHLACAILGDSADFGDPWCAIIGTAVHAWLDEAAAADNVAHDEARWYPELRVQPHPGLLPAGGKADLYDARRKTVIDHKIVGTTSQRKYKANGPGRQYRTQAHLYGKGYKLAGHDVQHVAIAFWLRGGRLDDLYVWTEPFSETIADEALERYQTLKNLLDAGGASLIPMLPRDPDCYDCKRNPQTPADNGGDTTRPDAA